MKYGTVDGLVAIVEDAIDFIEKPGTVVTGLPVEIVTIPSFALNIAQLTFLRRICSHGPVRYLEYGVWCGKSLCAASYGNTGSFVGVDSYDDERHGDQYLLDGCEITSLAGIRTIAESFVAGRNATLVNADCQTYKHEGPLDIFYYDADHSREQTRGGILGAVNLLNPGILVVDDFAWQTAYDGTVDALKEAGTQLHKSWFLPYHQGVFVAVVSPR